MPGAATVQPAPGPRPAARPARARRRDPRGHDGRRDRRPATRAGWAASGAGARRAPSRRGTAGGLRPVRVRTTVGRRAMARSSPARRSWRSTPGPRLAVVRAAPRDVVVVHRPDRAHPGPPGRHRLDRRRGRRRRPVHAALPADDAGRADRHRRRRRRAGFGGRIGAGVHRRRSCGARRAAAGLRRLFPSLRDVRIEDAWGGPIDISADHLPWFGSVRGRPIHYGHGYSGNGVGPSLVGGRILAARAVERADDPALALPLADGRAPRPFPPEPARYVGARLIREAAVRRETMEERGEDARTARCARSAGSRGGSATTSGPD